MKNLSLLARLLTAGAVCAALSGCLNLKPARSTHRNFVLSPLPANETGALASAVSSAPGVGIGQVKLPAYLFRDSIAVRKGTNELEYLEMARWAERLDTGFQRILASNLATLVPTSRIRLSAWRSQDVAVGVYVALERFDVDEDGRGVIVAWWRVVSPGGETVLKSGQFRASHAGPAPAFNTDGAVATLSELAAELSRELAKAIQEVTAQRVSQASTRYGG
jgi:uncharacterized lipoprotein YmbA